MAIVFATLLIASMSLAVIPSATVSAHTPPWDLTTFAYINVAPNPVGVGQQASILMWLDKTFDPSISLDKRLQIPQLQTHHNSTRRFSYNTDF